MSVRLFIGGLAPSTDHSALRQKFEEFGVIEAAFVMKNAETGLSLCFGFIIYRNDDDAMSAIIAMNNAELDGHVIKVDRASERAAAGYSGFGGGCSVSGH